MKQKKPEQTEKADEQLSLSSTGYQVPSVPERSLLPEEDMITTTIRYPRYVARLMDMWLMDHPGHTKTSLMLNGLRAMGQPIKDKDLLPARHKGRR